MKKAISLKIDSQADIDKIDEHLSLLNYKAKKRYSRNKYINASLKAFRDISTNDAIEYLRNKKLTF